MQLHLGPQNTCIDIPSNNEQPQTKITRKHLNQTTNSGRCRVAFARGQSRDRPPSRRLRPAPAPERKKNASTSDAPLLGTPANGEQTPRVDGRAGPRRCLPHRTRSSPSDDIIFSAPRGNISYPPVTLQAAQWPLVSGRLEKSPNLEGCFGLPAS